MSGSYSVIYSPKAKDDLREIYSYIAFTLLVPETAVGQVDRIKKSGAFPGFHAFKKSDCRLGTVEKHGLARDEV